MYVSQGIRDENFLKQDENHPQNQKWLFYELKWFARLAICIFISLLYALADFKFGLKVLSKHDCEVLLMCVHIILNIGESDEKPHPIFACIWR